MEQGEDSDECRPTGNGVGLNTRTEIAKSWCKKERAMSGRWGKKITKEV